MMIHFKSQHSEYGGDGFPFESFVRQRYHAFRRRRSFDLSTILQLLVLIAVLSLVVFALIAVVWVLVALLVVSPFIILAQAIGRALSGDRHRPPYPEDVFGPDEFGGHRPGRQPDHPPVIDIEVDRRG